jgi:hypothetical protein
MQGHATNRTPSKPFMHIFKLERVKCDYYAPAFGEYQQCAIEINKYCRRLSHRQRPSHNLPQAF